MVHKKTKGAAKKRQAAASGSSTMSANGVDSSATEGTEPTASGSNPPSASPDSAAPPSPSPPPAPTEPESPEEIKARAEKVKEQGNAAFKAAKYPAAIELYSKAIELNPSEPSYLTNRAASYMAVKRFRSALEDCQVAVSLQTSNSTNPPTTAPPKTLLRLAKCQLAVGSSTPAMSTIRSILAVEPSNSAALQLKEKVQALENHVKTFEIAKAKKEWGMARLALDKCLQAIEGEGGDIPAEWRYWRVELDLSRGNLEAANIAANDALRLNPNSPDALTLRGTVLFLSGRLPQSLQHVTSALRFDPGHEPAQKLRKRVKEVEKLKEDGNNAFKLGKLEEALKIYSDCLDCIGEADEEGKGGQIRATLLSNRATTLLKLNRNQEALADTDASLLLSPNSFKALRTRARLHLNLENYDASVADFKSAIEQSQADASAPATDAEVRSLKQELKKAEAALKRSKTKDYYKILGVSRTCTEIEIKKAYRRESLIHHPDKGGDEEKFKLVVEANAVLSDPRRRQRYDDGEDEDGLNQGGAPGGFGGGFNNMNQEDLADLFSAFGGGGFGGGMGGGRRGHGHSHGFSF